jgi:hypothetical protein
MDASKREAHLAKAREHAAERKAIAEAREQQARMVFKTIDDAAVQVAPTPDTTDPIDERMRTIFDIIAAVIKALERLEQNFLELEQRYSDASRAPLDLPALPRRDSFN